MRVYLPWIFFWPLYEKEHQAHPQTSSTHPALYTHFREREREREREYYFNLKGEDVNVF